MLSVKNQVFHVLSHGAAETEVMIPGEQALEEPQRVCIPSAPLRTSLNGIDLNWNKGPQVSGNSSGLMGNIGNKDRAFTLAGKRVVWGEGDIPPLLQLQQQAATGHILDLAIGETLVPQQA